MDKQASAITTSQKAGGTTSPPRKRLATDADVNMRVTTPRAPEASGRYHQPTRSLAYKVAVKSLNRLYENWKQKQQDYSTKDVWLDALLEHMQYVGAKNRYTEAKPHEYYDYTTQSTTTISRTRIVRSIAYGESSSRSEHPRTAYAHARASYGPVSRATLANPPSIAPVQTRTRSVSGFSIQRLNRLRISTHHGSATESSEGEVSEEENKPAANPRATRPEAR